MAATLEGAFRLIDRASPTLRAIERRAQAADRAVEKLGRSLDKLAARDAVARLDKLGGSMGQLEGKTNRVEKAFNKAGAASRQAGGNFDRNGNSVRKLTSDMGRFETMMRKVVVITSGLARIFKPVIFLAIAAAIRPLVGAVMSLVAGATALVQQIVSASGAIVPLIARMGDLAGLGAVAVTTMLSLKVATLTTKFAFDGVKEAIDGNAKALKRLTPEARAFVAEMKKLRPVMNTIRSSAQQGLFPGLTGAIRTARRNGAFRSANQAAGGVGAAVGGVAQRAADRFTDPTVLRDLTQQFGTFDFVIAHLGNAAISLADAFRNVLYAAQPLTRWVVTNIEQWAKYVDVQSRVGRDTGGLTRFFQRTRQTVTAAAHVVRDFAVGLRTIMGLARDQSGVGGIEKMAAAFRAWTGDYGNQARVALWFQRAQDSAHRLGSILVNVWNILTGLGKASSTLGTSMTEGIDKATGRWAEWVNSFGGQNKLSDWFNGMRSTLGQLWGLVSDIGGALARMGEHGGGANSLIGNIRAMLPDLERALTSINQNLGPGLFGTIQQLAHLLANLTAAGSGPLGMMLSAVASILGGVNDILDRFKLVRVAAAGAVIALGGAALIAKLMRIGKNVGDIAVKWGLVARNTAIATEAAATYGGVAAASSVRGGMPVMGGMPGFPRVAGGVAGVGGIVGAGGAAAKVAGAGRFARLGGMLKGPGLGLGLGVGLPIATGVGLSLAQDSGLLGSRRAGQAMNVASMAGMGAMAGSFFPGPGTLIGAGVGAGAGLLMNSLTGGGGPNPQQKYLASLSRTAGRSGFDITQMQGGAQDLAGAERYQRVLDQSLQRLRTERAKAAQNVSSTTGWVGGRFGQMATRTTGTGEVKALDAQIAANQRLRGENIARLGVERATLKAQEKQTDELRRQARMRQSRGIAANLLTSYGQAFNVYRKGGMSVGQATHETVTNMLSRGKTLNPAGARVLMEGGTQWLAQMKKKHPELKKEYDRFNTDMEGTLKKMGVTVTTSGGKVLNTTREQWKKIATSMQTPVEQARQKMNIAFTSIQNQARAVLIGLGYSPAVANNIIRSMEAGNAGPGMANPAASMQAQHPDAKARGGRLRYAAGGGRIPGLGLQDTVPIAPGTLAAPGELVVNRHTESKADRILRMAGTSLGGLVGGETKKHSDILPDAGIFMAKGGRLGRVIREANRIDAMRSPYSWGGSHGTPSNPMGPWDCSSATSRVLQAAGYNIPTMVSGSFMNWGQPGPGPIGIAANKGHVYMVINGRAWGTSHQNPGGGPGWISGGYRPGFVVRHAPGAGGAGGASPFDTGPGGLPLMGGGALNYAAVASGLAAAPYAGVLRGGHAEAVGLTGKVNQRLRKMAAGETRPNVAHKTMGGRVAWGGWNAGGMDAMVNGPTMIGVGERGPERVTVTPSGKGGGAHGPLVHVESIVIHQHGPGDVKRELDQAFDDLARHLDNQPAVGGA